MPIKRGKLRDIKVKEVSMVDSPANKQPFLFFKRDGAGKTQLTKAKKKIKIEIESDGTGKGTKITINGDKLGVVRDFSFYFYGNDAQSPISCNYSKVVESDDGFSRTETFYLSKGVLMKSETLKALQAYLDTEDIDFEKKVGEEKVQEAMELIVKEYKDDFPEDLVEAIGVLAKRAAGSYQDEEELNKAGAKFSKDVLKKLRTVLAAVEALKTILPEMKEATEKSGDDTNDELTKQIAKLNEAIAGLGESSKGKTKKDDAKGGAEKLTEALEVLSKGVESVSKRVEAMEKAGVTKTSLEEEETGETGSESGKGDKTNEWPSITGQIPQK